MLCTKKRYRAFFYVTNSKKYEENGKKGLEIQSLLKMASQYMEIYLQNDLDKHTIGAMFLLKCGYGYVESSKLDITTGDKSFATDVAEVNEAINRLGLDDE